MMVRSYVSTVLVVPTRENWTFFYPSQDIRQQAFLKIERTLDVIEQLLEYGSDYIALGDTTGMGNPRQVQFVLPNCKNEESR